MTSWRWHRLIVGCRLIDLARDAQVSRARLDQAAFDVAEPSTDEADRLAESLGRLTGKDRDNPHVRRACSAEAAR